MSLHNQIHIDLSLVQQLISIPLVLHLLLYGLLVKIPLFFTRVCIFVYFFFGQSFLCVYFSIDFVSTFMILFLLSYQLLLCIHKYRRCQFVYQFHFISYITKIIEISSLSQVPEFLSVMFNVSLEIIKKNYIASVWPLSYILHFIYEDYYLWNYHAAGVTSSLLLFFLNINFLLEHLQLVYVIWSLFIWVSTCVWKLLY